MLRPYRKLPEIQTGYPLDDVWSVVVPIARTNEVLNPSGETTTTGYTAGAGTLTRSTEQQYHGAYSFKYVPSAAVNDGFYYGTITTTSGQSRAIHCKLRGVAGVPYALTIATTGGVDLIVKPFIATGRWQWIILYHAETSSTTRRIYFRKNNSTNVGAFYVDGVQSEVITAGELASTYIDGDQLGLVPNQSPPAYVWNGTPHASTSTRSAQTRAGGMVIPFKKFGFLITALIGMGMAGVQNVATDYARIDGAYDDYSRKPPRQFTITGRFQGRTYAELRRNRSGLAQLFDRDLTGQDQRLTLLRHVEDGYGRILTSATRHLVKYESGFGGNTDNMHAETVPITFTQYLPNIIADGEDGESLNVQLSVSNASRIAQRSPAGVWSSLSTGANANVWSLFWASDGKLYAGGQFTTIGGVAANRVAYWDGTTWVAMGSGQAGVGSAVYAFAEGPDGSIYAAGDGTGFGGIANTAGLAKWNGSVWSSITGAGSANAAVIQLAIGPTGNLYAGGLFTTINAVASARIAQMTPAGTWTALAAGSSSDVYGIGFGVNGMLYITGETSGAGAWGVSHWTGSAWVQDGNAGVGQLLRAIGFGPNGLIYAGGQNTTMGGISAVGIAQYNGVSWSAMPTLAYSGGAVEVDAISVLRDGTVLAGGIFDTLNGVTSARGIARWNGSTWVNIDFDIAWTTVDAIAVKNDGTLVIGGQGATTSGVAAATTTITNTGTARAFPTIVINGPSSGTSRIYQISNVTTGRTIYLKYTINPGEIATLVLQPDSLSFTSDFQGNIIGTILPGSNEADFFLQPGANVISFFSASSTVTATIQWRPAYASLDDIN